MEVEDDDIDDIVEVIAPYKYKNPFHHKEDDIDEEEEDCVEIVDSPTSSRGTHENK
jgi:hypothetical protein